MLEGLEKVSSLITRYAMVEDMYLRRSSSSLEGQLSNALIRLYTSILVFLAKSRKFFSRKTGGQLWIRPVIHNVADTGPRTNREKCLLESRDDCWEVFAEGLGRGSCNRQSGPSD